MKSTYLGRISTYYYLDGVWENIVKKPARFRVSLKRTTKTAGLVPLLKVANMRRHRFIVYQTYQTLNGSRVPRVLKRESGQNRELPTRYDDSDFSCTTAYGIMKT